MIIRELATLKNRCDYRFQPEEFLHLNCAVRSLAGYQNKLAMTSDSYFDDPDYNIAQCKVQFDSPAHIHKSWQQSDIF